MILDLISRLPLYESQIPGAGRIAKAFAANRPQDAPCEVRLKSYAPKLAAQQRFEVHFHTIDLMMAKAGAEVIHLLPWSSLTPAEPLPNGADGRKLNGAPQGSAAVLEAGCFCAIFPGEAHMVGGPADSAPEGIEKWVVKTPAPELFCIEDNE
ncbi:MAG: YhcH/YjgK/YiaL family protein [Clostridia bacterium]|nr:YhcH/YjgK/YiaL family protein [Clostridia bacterium]